MIDIPRSSFYFIRHGETNINLENRFYPSDEDTPLNETGRMQSLKTGKFLKNFRIGEQRYFDAIYSSPLIRAKETADIISHQLGLDIIEDDRLIEETEGLYAGLNKDSDEVKDLKKQEQELKDWYRDQMDNDPIEYYGINYYEQFTTNKIKKKTDTIKYKIITGLSDVEKKIIKLSKDI